MEETTIKNNESAGGVGSRWSFLLCAMAVGCFFMVKMYYTNLESVFGTSSNFRESSYKHVDKIIAATGPNISSAAMEEANFDDKEPFRNVSSEKEKNKTKKNNNNDKDDITDLIPIHLPSVMLIGAQKGGSTAVSTWIFKNGGYEKGNGNTYSEDGHTKNRHNKDRHKELHFFNQDHRYEKGYELYSKMWIHVEESKNIDSFQKLSDGKRRLVHGMDATPNTLPYAERVWKIYKQQKVEKDLKVIFVARDPVGRELSWYNHMMYHASVTIGKKNCKVRYGYNNTSNANCLLKWKDMMSGMNIKTQHLINFDKRTGYYNSIANFHEYAKRWMLDNQTSFYQNAQYSLYAKYLKEWFHYFNRSQQILVLSYDELLNDPHQLMNRIAQFLGNKKLHDAVELAKQEGSGFPRKNKLSNQYKVSANEFLRTQQRLYDLFNPMNEEFYNLMETSGKGPPMEQKPFPKFIIRPANTSVSVARSNINNGR